MSNYRSDIDGLRAVAVASVIAFHYEPTLLPSGFLGVDLFFVISGYLITKNIRSDIARGTFTFADFYLRRIRRIVPALLATIALTLAFFSLVASLPALSSFSESAVASIFSISNFYFLAHSGYFDVAASTQPLLHTWSLGVEEQFYLLWPAVLLLTPRRMLPLTVVLLGLVSLVAAQLILSREAAFYLMPFRVFEFAIGALITFTREPTSDHRKDLYYLFGLALVVSSLLNHTDTSSLPNAMTLIPCFGAALMIWAGCARSALMISNPFGAYVGRISYSLYLVHWPVIVIAQYAAMRALTTNETAFCLGLTIPLSLGLFYLVERPFRSLSDFGFVIPKRTLIISTLLSSFALIAICASAGASGWTWRLGSRSALFNEIRDPKTFHLTYYGGSKCADGGCQSSPEQRKRIYVLGDSHAKAFYAGLSESFPSINFVFFAANSCPMFSMTYIAASAPGAEMCKSTKAKAYAEIKAKPSDVILIQNWSMYSYGMKTADDVRLKFHNDATFAAFAADQLSDMKATILPKNRLTVIGGVPRFRKPGSPYDCLARPGVPRCDSTDLSDPFVAKHFRFNAAFRHVYGSTEFIDPYEYLCSTTSCRNFDDDGKPIYSDEGHLSVWGSQYLVRAIWPSLQVAAF